MIGDCGIWSEWEITKCSDYDCYVPGQEMPREIHTRRCYSKLNGKDMDNCQGFPKKSWPCDGLPPCDVPYIGQQNCTTMPGPEMSEVCIVNIFFVILT